MKEYLNALMRTDQGWKSGGISHKNVETILSGHVLPGEQLDMFFEQPLEDKEILVTDIFVPLIHVGNTKKN